jgi:hypothetical protein
MSIVTVQDLLANRKKLKEQANKKIRLFSKELGGELVFKAVTAKSWLEILNMDYADKDAVILYEHCLEPNLKDDLLLESSKSKFEPYSMVDKFFSFETKYQIVAELLKESGLNQKSEKVIDLIIDDIKN